MREHLKRSQNIFSNKVPSELLKIVKSIKQFSYCILLHGKHCIYVRSNDQGMKIFIHLHSSNFKISLLKGESYMIPVD